jgi:hypothetical protein
MLHRFEAVVVVSVLIAAGCQSTNAPCADTQAVVESVAKQHPECLRLTVHSEPPAGGEWCVIASTVAEKLGKPSDKEDLDAMGTGRTIVLDEPGAIDVTVPILLKDAKWRATCGVTIKAPAGANREQLVANANTIAKAVEASMEAKSLPMKSTPAAPASSRGY